jgi:membrane protease YdiL (CAAX protease family)
MQKGVVAALVVWCACEVLMLLFDRGNAWIGAVLAAYSLLLWLCVARIVPLDLPAEENVFRTEATGLRLWLRVAVVLASMGFVYVVFVLWFSGTLAVPWMTQMNNAVVGALPPGIGSGFCNFIFLALIPGALLFVVGARPRELGLTPTAKRTWLAAIPCLILPVAAIVFGLWRGHLTAGLVGLLIVHNVLSNGFSEEFFARGMIFSQLRAFLAKDWALFGQAVLFALYHYGATPEEHGNVVMTVANVISENLPIALALGLIALRTRSLLLPTVLHTSIDTMFSALG